MQKFSTNLFESEFFLTSNITAEETFYKTAICSRHQCYTVTDVSAIANSCTMNNFGKLRDSEKNG